MTEKTFCIDLLRAEGFQAASLIPAQGGTGKVIFSEKPKVV